MGMRATPDAPDVRSLAPARSVAAPTTHVTSKHRPSSDNKGKFLALNASAVARQGTGWRLYDLEERRLLCLF